LNAATADIALNAHPNCPALERRPAICGGCESREELQTNPIRGTSMYRN